MSKRKRIFSLIICIFVLLTACSEATTEADNNAAAGVSGETTSSGVVVRPEELPDRWGIRGYRMDAAFMIRERSTEGYRATVKICDYGNMGDADKICLELEDEITNITGAKIVSRKGKEYMIQGTGDNEKYYGQTIRFDIDVRCPGGAHEPGMCYFYAEIGEVPEKNYKFEVSELVEEGTEVRGTLKFTNCCEESFENWRLEFGSNFPINSLNGARIYNEFDYETEGLDDFWDEDEEDEEEDDEYDDWRSYEGIFFSGAFWEWVFDPEQNIWCYDICGEGQKCSLQKGESIEISFTGKRAEWKPKVSGAKEVYADKEEQINWGIIEKSYGAKYGKIEKYLVADSVAGGVDLFFVFDEKKNDSYTATAELTNILKESDACPEEKADSKERLEIADWEICLECEDTIEEIEGAEIIAHEGNVYRIRATDKNKWIPRYGLETFQVKVSCEGEIHHLGKVYLAKARYRGKEISSRDTQKELNMLERASAKSFGARWRTYQDLYEEGKITYYDPKYDPEKFRTKEEEDAFYKRRKWGKKMGR